MYAAAERLFDLISDSQDVRRHQSSSPGKNRNSRSSSPKAVRGDKRSGKDRKPYQSNTRTYGEGKIIEAHPSVPSVVSYASLIADSNDKSNQAEDEVGQIDGGEKTRIGVIKYQSSLQKRGRSQTSKVSLGEGFKKNEDREFRCPTYRRTSEMNDDKVGRMEGPCRLYGYIRQSNGFKMISVMQLDKNLVQEEPPSAAIPHGALGKLGETVPKDTLYVPEKYHSVMPKSWPKSLSMRRMTDHGIESPSEAKAPAKNAHRTMPPSPFPEEEGQKFTTGLETTGVTGLRAYEFPVAPFSLTDAKGGKCCFVQRQINVLGHVVEFHQIEGGKRKFMEGFLKRRTSSLTELLKEEDIQSGGNLECQAVFNRLKQAPIEGPSLGVADASNPSKVEAEQFNCMLEEYLYHFVDGRQKNLVQLSNVVQFGHSAQTNSLIKRSEFEITSSRHYVLPPLTDGPYVGNNPQVHKVEKEWEQMANITRVCLGEASRSMEEKLDQKRCPLEFEWMTKLLINGATTPYDYLSTWNKKKIEKSRKSLLTE
ncbi:RNA-directed DNA polymerase-like protein [Cucumis melo var. makuwa]|nr:RNA-directed DNA polymerase-like protein [Cucumis melo var. makuwa]